MNSIYLIVQYRLKAALLQQVDYYRNGGNEIKVHTMLTPHNELAGQSEFTHKCFKLTIKHRPTVTSTERKQGKRNLNTECTKN